MKVIVTVPQAALEKHPTMRYMLSTLSLRVVEHAQYGEYETRQWQSMLDLLKEHRIDFVFKPLYE